LAPQRATTSSYDGQDAIRTGFRLAWDPAGANPVTGFRDVCVHDTAEHEFDAVNPRTGVAFTSGFLLVLRGPGPVRSCTCATTPTS
jgi:hypothetical protein